MFKIELKLNRNGFINYSFKASFVFNYLLHNTGVNNNVNNGSVLCPTRPWLHDVEWYSASSQCVISCARVPFLAD